MITIIYILVFIAAISVPLGVVRAISEIKKYNDRKKEDMRRWEKFKENK